MSKVNQENITIMTFDINRDMIATSGMNPPAPWVLRESIRFQGLKLMLQF